MLHIRATYILINTFCSIGQHISLLNINTPGLSIKTYVTTSQCYWDLNFQLLSADGSFKFSNLNDDSAFNTQ